MTALTAKRNTTMPAAVPSEKRPFSGTPLNANAKVTNTAGQKIKNFFRINSKNDVSQTGSETGSQSGDGSRTPQSAHTNGKSSLRNSRFIPHLGRSRSTTVASEGNPLADEAMSPTAHANPYFQHQGPPALRHHNDNSVPPSPPDTPQTSKKIAPENAGSDASGKEELARKLRRVASAPNAQGLFSRKKRGSNDSRPQTAEENMAVPKINGITAHGNASTSALSTVQNAAGGDEGLLPVPGIAGAITPGKLRNSIAFRRTYSSNSIKVRNVEVGPGSFDKIKLIGKGDVGKVYLVREKKSARLYAMKGKRRRRRVFEAWGG